MLTKLNNFIKSFLIDKPTLSIILITTSINLFAIIFSKGYGMHDDHFGPIEQPWEVLNNPELWKNRGQPHAHSLFYPLLHFCLFKILYYLSFTDPQEIMYVVRLLHFIYHLIGILFLYKILTEIFDPKISLITILAYIQLWFIPFMNVRNLIEMVCIPPMVIGFWLLIKYPHRVIAFLGAGAFFALAFTIRYQTLIITGTVLIYILTKDKLNFSLFFTSLVLFALLFQGLIDIYAWGYPFASFYEYVRYNFSHSHDYTTGPFYRYLLLLLGIFIPPISIFILYYFIKNFKKYDIIFFSTLAFLLLHSIFPNKQERFILPIIPFVFVLGTSSLLEAIKIEKFWIKKKKFAKFLYIWFVLINLPLLATFSTNYSKKTRCESLYYLSTKQDVKSIFYFFGKIGSFKPPEFYLNNYGIKIIQINDLGFLKREKKIDPFPNYAIFFGGEEVDSLKKQAEIIIGKKFLLDKIIAPSLVDFILYKLNPKYNRNQTAKIFKIEN